jgi:hypothetical protein
MILYLRNLEVILNLNYFGLYRHAFISIHQVVFSGRALGANEIDKYSGIVSLDNW